MTDCYTNNIIIDTSESEYNGKVMQLVVFDRRGYWIRNTDKNNTGLNGARLKASLQ